MTLTDRAGRKRGRVTLELDDIQATALRYRPEPYYGTHVMLRVDEARSGREFLRRLTPQVDSAADWWRAAEPWIAVAITYSGLVALGVPEDSLQSFPESFRAGMAARARELLDHGANDQVQLCTDLDSMPVNEVTVEWPETLSPFVTVGRVHVPRQDISGPDNFEKGDALAFNQWRVTADHRPLGEIMNVRRIYAASAKVRRTLNHQTQAEPTSPEEVLPQVTRAAASSGALTAVRP
jgi:hypothetical protein